MKRTTFWLLILLAVALALLVELSTHHLTLALPVQTNPGLLSSSLNLALATPTGFVSRFVRPRQAPAGFAARYTRKASLLADAPLSLSARAVAPQRACRNRRAALVLPAHVLAR